MGKQVPYKMTYMVAGSTETNTMWFQAEDEDDAGRRYRDIAHSGYLIRGARLMGSVVQAVPVTEDLRTRVATAVQEADLAFWDTISKRFPEVKSGDFPPDLMFQMEDEQTHMVERWLHLNHPDLRELCRGKIV